MNKHCIKQLSALALGIFLTNAAPLFGQTNTDTPVGNKIGLGGETLYEHGYNKEAGPDAPREVRDTVMVGSTMNYFVMPDKFYNKLFFEQTDYSATDKTNSKFLWEVNNPSFASAITPKTVNGTNTSPWVEIDWAATGNAEIKILEQPQVTGMSALCFAAETIIPVTIIAKPAITFDLPSSGTIYSDVECVNPSVFELGGAGEVTVNYPITVSSQSGNVRIKYILTTKDIDGNAVGTPVTKSDVWVSKTTGTLPLTFTGFGVYEVKITEITDHIARKCNMTGDVTTDNNANVFTYSIVPIPTTGKTYHVPNNFQ